MVAFVSATLIAVGPAISARSSVMAAKSAKTQSRMAIDQAAADAAAAERAFNAANKKTPSLGALAAANKLPGMAATMLTGPTGVQQSGLTIGKTSLLGG